MKAIIWSKYGSADLLKLGELKKPVPKDDEVLIKVKAATVTAGDCELRKFDIHPLFWLPLRLILGVFKPNRPTLGQEFAGEIEAVGNKVTTFKIGDQVFGGTGIRIGAYAEYRCQKASFPMVTKPKELSFEEAATITTGGINGIHFLRNANLKKGQKLLINGAGGSIGTYALQLAKLEGLHVTCVDSASKLNMLKSTGADEVIDFREIDFSKAGNKYNAIIDVVGGISFSRCLESLNPGGKLVLGNPKTSHMFRSWWTNKTGTKKVKWKFAGDNVEDLNYLKQLMVEGKVKAIIDKSYPLDKVPEAHEYVDKGLKKGNLVIKIGAFALY
ncbi:MAG: NAD(P)-dependent alcohol dehydrogenase [Cyclobacteriaceae bacterium]